jgi:uncharacterized protein (DUF58 family)
MRAEAAVRRAVRASGTRAALEDLLALRAAAAALGLAAPPTAGEAGGAARSRLRGRGIEFEEVRAYAPGDDVRTIDWRVTARTGRPHTRVFRAERERPVYLLLDQRTPMFFGSRGCLKSVQALHALALFAWCAVDAGDRVGGLVLGDTAHHERRPRRSRRAVLELLRLGLEANHGLGAPRALPAVTVRLADALHGLRRVARPGGLALLISDFHDWDEEAHRQLVMLARHVEVHGVCIVDPLERELPAVGAARVSDGAHVLDLDTGSARLRARYRAERMARASRLAASFVEAGAPLRELSTDAAAAATLGRWYRRTR